LSLHDALPISSATRISVPRSQAFLACFTDATTVRTHLFIFLSLEIYGDGFPADKETAGISYSSESSIIASTSVATLMAILMPKGRPVSLFVSLMIASTSSGSIVPHPIIPSPPASETAAAQRALLILPMPPCIIGYVICNCPQTGFIAFPPIHSNAMKYIYPVDPEKDPIIYSPPWLQFLVRRRHTSSPSHMVRSGVSFHE